MPRRVLEVGPGPGEVSASAWWSELEVDVVVIDVLLCMVEV